MSVNKVILIGNLGADPEVRHLDDSRKVANMRLATNESYTDKQGQKVTQTEWHSLEVWGSLASLAENYLKKGTLLYVEGKIHTNSWQDQEGNTRYQTKIKVNAIKILSSASSSQGVSDNQQAPPPSGDTKEANDDLPF